MHARMTYEFTILTWLSLYRDDVDMYLSEIAKALLLTLIGSTFSGLFI